METFKTLTFLNTLLALLLCIALFILQLYTIAEMHTGADPAAVIGYCFGYAFSASLSLWIVAELVCLVVIALVSVIKAAEQNGSHSRE